MALAVVFLWAVSARANHCRHYPEPEMGDGAPPRGHPLAATVRANRCPTCNTADQKDVQGFAAFMQFGWAPPDRNPATQYLGAGVVYKGLIPRRDNDTCGLGMGKVYFSDRLPDVGSEAAIELFCKARLGKYVFIQPDLKYIAQPSSVYRDAFAVGLRFQMAM